MADKMMRIAGRDPNGNAKNISVDGDGKQSVFDGQAHLLLENLQQETTQLQTKVQEVTDRLNQTLDTQLTGSYVRQSSQGLPSGGQEGNECIFWDTKQFFLHDGTQWRELSKNE